MQQNIRQTWLDDDELFTIIRTELYTAVIGDIMDGLGYMNQFLPVQIRPVAEGYFIAGRAMTVLEADVVNQTSVNNPLLNKPFGLMLEALDDLQKNEIYVCTGALPTYALWGELMSVRAKYLGAAGAIVDGYSRDTNGIRKVGLPVFSYGCFAQDQAPRGKVIDYRVPLNIKGVAVCPGDILVGDVDGVCVVPQEIETEVFQRAIEKARGERTVLKRLQEGMSASAAFEQYKIM